MSLKHAIFWLAIVLACGAGGMAEESWRERVDALLMHLPQPARLQIEHRAVLGLPGHSAWHIGDTLFRIRLHPEGRFDLEKLDRERIYEVTGIVVEQNYGVVEVWVREVRQVGSIERP